MRFFRIVTSVACLLAAASAVEIKIKAVDPQSAVVAGAQVVLTFKGSSTPVAVATGTKIVSTSFDVPATAETGASSLVVVTNGIPSAPVDVTVQ